VIKGYLSKINHDETVDIEAIVEDTPHATPAQIAAAITKDSVRIALFNGRNAISQRDIDKALQEQALGIEQPIEEWDAEQRRQVAYHEAGHAVAAHYLMPEQRLVRASIIRRGGALGYVLPVDRVEVYAYPLRRLAAQIMVFMAGHVSVKLFMGEYWSGASSDFSIVRRLIWGLYTFGYFGPPMRGWENSQSSGIPPGADPLIERFWKMLEDQTENLLRQHPDEVEAIAQALLEKGDLSHDELMALMGDNGWRPDKPRELPRREPAQLPEPVKLPLPAPAPVGVETAAGQAEEPAAAAAERPEKPEVVSGPAPRPTRMMTPPRPDEIARRRPPAEPEAKAEGARDKKD
jgi:cell division protease FtsH